MKKIIITISLIITASVIVILADKTFFPSKIFDLYCKRKGEFIIYSVNTHGKENVNYYYLYLFNKGRKINHLLENNFFDESKTNMFFNEIRLKKGDIAWFIYSDINFNDDILNKLLNKYNIPTGTELFLETLKNPLLRNEYLYNAKMSHTLR